MGQQFKAGNWVKVLKEYPHHNGKLNCLYRIISISGLGFLLYESGASINPNRIIVRLATNKEIEEHLIAEAKKRGYIAGMDVDTHFNGWQGMGICRITNKGYIYHSENDRFQMGGTTIYYNGQWAQIINQQTKGEEKVNLPEKFQVIVKNKTEHNLVEDIFNAFGVTYVRGDKKIEYKNDQTISYGYVREKCLTVGSLDGRSPVVAIGDLYNTLLKLYPPNPAKPTTLQWEDWEVKKVGDGKVSVGCKTFHVDTLKTMKEVLTLAEEQLGENVNLVLEDTDEQFSRHQLEDLLDIYEQLA